MPISPADMSSYMERPANTALFSVSTRPLFETTSATASRGYDNKMVLWGTACTSLMVACMRRYLTFTGETAHVVDELFLVKTCTSSTTASRMPTCPPSRARRRSSCRR